MDICECVMSLNCVLNLLFHLNNEDRFKTNVMLEVILWHCLQYC